MTEKVILVDENDSQIGEEEKLKAHQEGKLHRAFSIFIFNGKNQLLLQRRALTKYHSKGLWTNTCCSHPRIGESVQKAAERRLEEEMGFTCKMEEVHEFIYREPVGEGLTEHEYDHVFAGKLEGKPRPNSEEVMEIKWLNKNELLTDIKKNPEKYTEWFKIIVRRELGKIWR